MLNPILFIRNSKRGEQHLGSAQRQAAARSEQMLSTMKRKQHAWYLVNGKTK
jgi:hypothetical protein